MLTCLYAYVLTCLYAVKKKNAYLYGHIKEMKNQSMLYNMDRHSTNMMCGLLVCLCACCACCACCVFDSITAGSYRVQCATYADEVSFNI